MIRSELLNMRATPTARLLLAGSMAMALASFLANAATFTSSELAQTASIEQIMHASTVATLTFALVAGIVSSTSDYRFGRIDQLLLSVPDPTAVVRAKASVGAIVGLMYGTAGSAVALTTLSIYYRASGVAIDLTSPIVLRPLAGVIVGSALFVAAGVGLGTIIRNQPAALATGLIVLLVVQPTLLLGAPTIGKWLPGAAGLSMTLAPDPVLLSQLAGTLLMIAWSAAALIVGRHRLHVTGA